MHGVPLPLLRSEYLIKQPELASKGVVTDIQRHRSVRAPAASIITNSPGDANVMPGTSRTAASPPKPSHPRME